MKTAKKFTDLFYQHFWSDGFIVAPELASSALCDELKTISMEHLGAKMSPIEYEVDVQYPGSPRDQSSKGANTPRRLLHAYSRDAKFRDWSTSKHVSNMLSELFKSKNIMLSQCHHNCVMTKHAGFSSATPWHQDNRYWNYDEPNLITVWLALGDETKDNGSLRVIPGSHKLELDRGRLDAALFLRSDLETNKKLIRQARLVELRKGDVLFFHSRLFHAAGRNLTLDTKYSVVFTYHQAANKPIENTRSSAHNCIAL